MVEVGPVGCAPAVVVGRVVVLAVLSAMMLLKRMAWFALRMSGTSRTHMCCKSMH